MFMNTILNIPSALIGKKSYSVRIERQQTETTALRSLSVF